MKIKKEIKKHFDSIQIPSAKKVLPEEVLIPQTKKTTIKLKLIIATVLLCALVVAAGLAIGLNENPDPSQLYNSAMQDGDASDINSSTQNDKSIFSAEMEESQPDFDIDGSSEDTSSLGQTDVPDGGHPNVSSEPDISDISNNVDVSDVSSEPDIPLQPLKVYHTENTGEFAGDMYRPDGYDKKIGSVLAIMLSMNKDEETRFDVLVHTYDLIDLKEFLSQKFDFVEVITVEIDSGFAGEAYYVRLTDSQIKELTGYGLKCYYIGSGLGDYKDMNWETEEGIRTYCEIWGDMYTFNKRGITYTPDISAEN